MPSTRSSEKNEEPQANGSSEQAAGAKHDMEEKTSPAPKRAKKDDDGKTQMTIEESMPEYGCTSFALMLSLLTILKQRQRWRS